MAGGRGVRASDPYIFYIIIYSPNPKNPIPVPPLYKTTFLNAPRCMSRDLGTDPGFYIKIGDSGRFCRVAYPNSSLMSLAGDVGLCGGAPRKI